VGAAYARCARSAAGGDGETDWDTEEVRRAIERGFGRAMRETPPLAFGDLAEADLEAAERGWWRAVARAALAEADLLARVDFEGFFDRAWWWFGAPRAWHVPEDVRPALRALRAAGVPLAVFSNWDRRLVPLLGELGLGGFFARVVVSSALAAAKPDPAAYRAASAVFERGAPAWRGAPIMVGDRLDHDALPALAAGWGAVWLDRGGAGDAPAGVSRIRTLADLPGCLTTIGVA
jgi:FMN phosphatase YigB (HAD superfamily)